MVGIITAAAVIVGNLVRLCGVYGKIGKDVVNLVFSAIATKTVEGSLDVLCGIYGTELLGSVADHADGGTVRMRVEVTCHHKLEGTVGNMVHHLRTLYKANGLIGRTIGMHIEEGKRHGAILVDQIGTNANSGVFGLSQGFIAALRNIGRKGEPLLPKRVQAEGILAKGNGNSLSKIVGIASVTEHIIILQICNEIVHHLVLCLLKANYIGLFSFKHLKNFIQAVLKTVGTVYGGLDTKIKAHYLNSCRHCFFLFSFGVEIIKESFFILLLTVLQNQPLNPM